MANKMLIDTTHPEETRVVVVRGNRVEEFDFESANRRQLRGNIYLAKVTRVEPSLQAAFVEYGGNRHGFLAFSEIHPDYYQIPVADRQALIEEEERAHRDAEDEHDRRAGRSHGGRRSRSAEASSSSRRSEVVRDDQDASEIELASEPAVQTLEAAADDLTHPDAGDQQAHATGGDRAAWAGEPGVGFVPADGDIRPLDAPVLATDHVPGLPEPHDHAAAGSAEHHSDHAGYDDSRDPTDTIVSEAAEAEAEARRHGGGEQHGDIEEVDSDEEEEIVESVGGADALEEVQERLPRYRRQYKIQEVIKRRQVMLVQVVKEERGTKGAALTTYLSLAGRYSVLMPNTARGGGISRKITSAPDRKRLKQIAQDLEVPEGMGVILRTAGANRTKAEVKRDFEYLLRMWETVRDLTLKSTAPKLTYEEGSLIKRSIRDLYNKDIDEVVVAGEDGYREAKDFMRMLMPSHAKNVKLYRDSQPVFTRYGVEGQLDAMFSPIVQLRSGGYIVINQAEALVAIDVNSGRATREHHIEDTALKTNTEAAEEIARQLRLRDLAGLIVIDFIDMDEKRNNRSVERKLKECLKNDRARIQVGRISHFGLLEMSRQRIRSSVLESTTEKCPHCGGTGHVRSVSSVTLQLLRSIEETLLKGGTHDLIVRTRSDIALYVLNHKRAHLRELESRFHITITVNADDSVNAQQPFLIERGEQVHSVEAARAIAAQAGTAAPALVEDDEDEDFPAEADAEAESEDDEDSEDDAEVAGETPAETAEEAAEVGEDGTRRRRRRRRRRRPGEAADHADGAREPAGASADADAEAGSVDDEEAEPAGAAAPAETNGNGEAERRRRRRGRRGGRRSRRDEGEGHPPQQPAAGTETAPGWNDWAQAPQADAVEPPARPQFEPAANAPEFAPEPAYPAPVPFTPALPAPEPALTAPAPT
ncbi:MAG TPA: Rne/Rng family ribonuclease, partial [Xanthobacteraceae bacterium]